jgi:hypothetical protein
MELNSYGMDFYDNSSNNYHVGTIGHVVQQMLVLSSDGETYKMQDCDGLAIAAYPQTIESNFLNYFLAFGLGSESEGTFQPLMQIYGYPASNEYTENRYEIDLGQVSYYEEEQYTKCWGMRLASNGLTTNFIFSEDLNLYQDPGEESWWLYSKNIASFKILPGKGGTDYDNGIGIYPTILFQNVSGDTGTITLSDNVMKYDFIEIYYLSTSDGEGGYSQNCTRVWQPNGKSAFLTTGYNGSSSFNLKMTSVLLSGTQITKPYGYWEFNNNSSSATNFIGITRVIGYK